MPKSQRTIEEIEKSKIEILDQAVTLIVEIGYNNFTMRKLASRLGITATTIYNYYKNKDDLFLNILIRGFKALYGKLTEVRQNHKTPAKALRAMVEAYMDFGLNNANFYNLMYSWDVPKYNDYVGTSMEPVARMQLECALKIPQLFTIALTAYAQSLSKVISDDDMAFLIVHYWCQLHGFIAGFNNTILFYLHNDPPSIKKRHIDSIMQKLKEDILWLKNQGEKK